MSAKKIQSALSDLSIFYDKNLPEMTINIYLFASPKESSGIGEGAILKEKGITLEIRNLKDIRDYLLIILHEIAHSFLEKNSVEKVEKIVKKYKFPSNNLIKERGKTNLISELILSSFVPNGYLIEKYFNIPIRKMTKKYIQITQKKLFFAKKWSFLEKYIVFHLYPLAKKYIENKKKLDENYIKIAIETTIQAIKFRFETHIFSAII